MFKTNNQHIKFIANSILVIALIFIMDLVAGNVLRHLYFMSKAGGRYHLTYALNSTKASVIILGSSRAREHYVPEIIEDSLNLECFNTGLDGHFILNSCAICKSILKRYTPQIVLMDINTYELFVEEDDASYEGLSYLLPYYRDNKEIRDIIELKSDFERIKLISKIYPYNSTLLAIGNGLLRTEDINESKGFHPLSGNLRDTTIAILQGEINEYDNYRTIDTVKLNVLENLVSECNSRHISLILIQSPKFPKRFPLETSGDSILNNFALKHNLEFWNYVTDTIFWKPEYFFDHGHMNKSGAYEFTKAVAERLQVINQHKMI